MKGKITEIKNLLIQYPQYTDTLFRRGYLITNREFDNLLSYPFYNNWRKYMIDKYKNFNELNFYIHNKQDYCMSEDEDVSVIIIGHAYNPFDMKYKENELLQDCIYAYRQNKQSFFDKISEFTGVHLIVLIDKDNVIAVQDCSGMKSCYFGKVGEDVYLTSHPQLVGDICELERDSFVEELTKSFCYNIGARYLPGNITPFKELKRLGPNTYIEYNNDFIIKRFYPTKPHSEVNTQEQFSIGINKIFEIMHNNIELSTKKWERPAISLSGGTDSKTTLACTNGLYDKLSFFSFHCKPQEIVDAEAAHKICDHLGLSHIIYPIPDTNEKVEDFNVLKRIIDHNTSYFMNLADHEIRKMITLYRLDICDIELKSWVSETARVTLERRYKIHMPKVLHERHFSIFQTRYFLTPSMLNKSDMIYRKFMKEIEIENPIYNFEHVDLFQWEMRFGSWGTSVVSALDFCHNVTMPYNNRRLIELFLSFPRDSRKRDEVHKAVIAMANSNIVELGIEIHNLYSRPYRAWMEKLYYYYRTLFYSSKEHCSVKEEDK